MSTLTRPLLRLLTGAALLGAVVGSTDAAPSAAAAGPISTVDLVGPAGSGLFGFKTLVLANGNIVVSDPLFDSALQPDVGAVYLFNGSTGALLSTLHGSAAQDTIGLELTEVGDSNVLVGSSLWHNGALANAGAMTWMSGTTGLSGVVSAANSYVGGSANDFVGGLMPDRLANGNAVLVNSSWHDATTASVGAATWFNGNAPSTGVIGPANSIVGSTEGDFYFAKAVPLTNGNFVIATPGWNGPGATDAGAATWGNGATGTAGVISPAISLVGTKKDDSVAARVKALTNGNYVVTAPSWDNVAITDAGAAVWANGSVGIAGPVTAANSLRGGTVGDQVGAEVTALSDGNYVVQSPRWQIGVAGGAATWADGSVGRTGLVTASNSIYGTTSLDFIGAQIEPLTNGKFVVYSSAWDNGGVVDAGVALLADSTSVGPVTTTGSLYGTSPSDHVGSFGVLALANGSYVVRSPNWTNGVPNGNLGAVTWGSGAVGVSGPVSAANSWVGATVDDSIGFGSVVELSNGNFVLGNARWDAGAVVNAGAATWGSGVTGGGGVVSAANSLVGSSMDDAVGARVVAVGNGDYVVASPDWNKGVIARVGAVTRGNGQTGSAGAVSTANSLTGTSFTDLVGTDVKALSDGSFIVQSDRWDNGGVDMGAATWIAAGGATVGSVTTANSLVGSTAGDHVGIYITSFADGSFAVFNPAWSRGATLRSGAVSYGDPGSGAIGPITASNSVLGGLADKGANMVVAPRKTSGGAVVVSRQQENIVTLLKPYVAPPSDPNDPNDPNDPTPTDKTDYVPLPPARLVDTRVGYSTVDGAQAGDGRREVGSTLEVQVASRGGVAGDASAVALNVTSVDSAANGFVTVFPCGEERPTASNVNVSTGSTVPNAVLSKIGVDGKVCVFTSQPMDLVVDSAGYFSPTSSYKPANPARVLDSRAAGLTADGQQQAVGLREAGSVTEVQITGRVGVPVDASTAALNVTATEAEGPGYVTVFPCGEPRPLASSLNYVTGGTVANLVLAKIGADGKVCLYTQLGTHLIVDVGGYFPAATSYKSLNPARMLETRDGLSTFDAQFNGLGILAASTVTEVKVTGRGGVPANAATVVLNVTVTEPDAAGYVTVYPCGIEPPLASNLNYVGGQTVANATVVKVGANGNVCVYNSQKTHLVIDVSGYLPPAG